MFILPTSDMVFTVVYTRFPFGMWCDMESRRVSQVEQGAHRRSCSCVCEPCVRFAAVVPLLLLLSDCDLRGCYWRSEEKRASPRTAQIHAGEHRPWPSQREYLEVRLL